MVEARLFQALSDPTRLGIMGMLAGGPMNVSSMVGRLGSAQPAVSRHLRVLREVGLIRDERKGKEVEYSISPDRVREARVYLEDLLRTARVTGAVGAPEKQVGRDVRPETGAAGATEKRGGRRLRAATGAGDTSGAGPRHARKPRGAGIMRSHTRRGRRKAEAGPEPKPEPETETRFVVKREQDTMDDFLL
jgi:DNA-binding transcriptional ArsR family regulator